MIRRHELPYWIAFFGVAFWILATFAFAYPVECLVIAVVVSAERFAEFIYQADRPRASTMLKGNGANALK